VITITGIGDHLRPEWLIIFTGMRNWSHAQAKLSMTKPHLLTGVSTVAGS
jgi:hypothetical protein